MPSDIEHGLTIIYVYIILQRLTTKGTPFLKFRDFCDADINLQMPALDKNTSSRQTKSLQDPN